MPIPLLPPLVEQRMRDFAGHGPLQIRHPGAAREGSDLFCHALVREQVTRHGGRQCYGWLHSVPAPSDARHGAHGVTFHSVWLSPEGQLVDLSPHGFSRDGWSLFIPDARRAYDFIGERGYNALVIYTDIRHCRHVRQLNGLALRPGALYWASHLYLLPVDAYTGRFRRASRHLPEIQARYGLKTEEGRLTGLERLNRQQRIELAFNYGIH